MKLAQIRKLIAAAVGLILLFATNAGWLKTGLDPELVNSIVSLLTLIAVYAIPNAQVEK